MHPRRLAALDMDGADGSPEDVAPGPGIRDCRTVGDVVPGFQQPGQLGLGVSLLVLKPPDSLGGAIDGGPGGAELLLMTLHCREAREGARGQLLRRPCPCLQAAQRLTECPLRGSPLAGGLLQLGHRSCGRGRLASIPCAADGSVACGIDARAATARLRAARAFSNSALAALVAASAFRASATKRRSFAAAGTVGTSPATAATSASTPRDCASVRTATSGPQARLGSQ